MAASSTEPDPGSERDSPPYSGPDRSDHHRPGPFELWSRPSARRVVDASWAHPVVLFVAAGALTVVALASWCSSWFRTRPPLTRRSSMPNVTKVIAHSVAEPAIPMGLTADEAAAIDRFDQHDIVAGCWSTGSSGSRSGRDGAHHLLLQGAAHRREAPASGGPEQPILKNGGTAADAFDLQSPRTASSEDRAASRGLHAGARSDRTTTALRGLLPLQRRHRAKRANVAEFRPDTVAGLLIFLLLTVPLSGRSPGVSTVRRPTANGSCSPRSRPPTSSAAGSPVTCTTVSYRSSWRSRSPCRRRRRRPD